MDEINTLVSRLDQRCFKGFFQFGCAKEVEFPLFAVEMHYCQQQSHHL